MSRSLAALIVEDSEDDAELVVRELRRAGYQVRSERVDTSETMKNALNGGPWDIVISDYSMPHFSGLEALDALKASELDLPFILVSGVVGEDAAIEAMRRGAHDYLMKSNLSRLAPAVARELREAEARRERRQAEEKVREQAALIELAHDAIIVLDRNRRIVLWSHGAEQTYGWTRDEAIDKPVPSLLRTRFPIPLEQIKAALFRENHWEGELIHTRRSGEEIVVTSRWALQRGSRGEPVGTLEINRDITRRKKAEESLSRHLEHLEDLVKSRTTELTHANQQLQQEVADRIQAEATLASERTYLQAIFDSTNVGMMLIGEDRTVRRANNAILHWAGKNTISDLNSRPGDVLGCIHAIDEQKKCGSTTQCAVCSIRNTIEAVLQIGRATHHREIEMILSVHGQRMRFCLEMSVDPVNIEGRTCAILAMLDITDRKRTEEALKLSEEALRNTNEQLEQRVRERTEELTKTVDRLQTEVEQRQEAEQRLTAANEDLAARAAQLRALAGELTHAEQRERRRLAKILHDHLQQLLVGAKFRTAILGRNAETLVKQATVEIAHLLDEAIDASRSLTAELSPPILHEAGLAMGLEWLARWMLEKHGLRVELALGEYVEPAAEDVKSFLFESVKELLFNVVKHAHTRSARINLRRVEGETLQVIVSDNGPGFNPSIATTAGAVGGGFGLFSIRERLDLIGGSVEIESAPGKGARITLLAPLGQVFAGPAPNMPRSPESQAFEKPPMAHGTAAIMHRIRVLLADDHMVMRQGLKRLLEPESDIEVVGEAADGLTAVELARKLSPDAVLMDISMPKLNGIDATRMIHSACPRIHIIGLSMFEEPEQAQAIVDAGASVYLTKSGPVEALLKAIRSSTD